MALRMKICVGKHEDLSLNAELMYTLSTDPTVVCADLTFAQ